MTARTDLVRTVREAKAATRDPAIGPGGEPAMLASGRLASFQACYGKVTRHR
jgi:arginine N-succinyltransferase